MPESASAVHLQIGDGIAKITLDQPPLNVLDTDSLHLLNQALATCASSSVRVVLLRSVVTRAFSAGVEIRDHGPDRLDAMLREVQEQARQMLTLEAVTIAAINGSTLGGGAELALLCDIVIAADDARLGLPEIGLAAFPPIATAILPERWAWPVAMRLLLGETIDASTARELGLLADVVPVSALHPAAEARAKQLAGYSGVAIRGLTLATRRARATGILRRVDEAIEIYKAVVGPSRDAQEGVDAFLEKRTPAWSHR